MLPRPFTNNIGAFKGAPQWSSPAAGTLPNGTGATAYSQSLSGYSVTGSALTYSLASGTLPPGLSVSGTTLSGTLTNPASDTTYNFILKVAEPAYNSFSERPFAITVTSQAITDTYYSSVQYLYHGDQSFTDASAKNRTLAVTNPNATNGSTTNNPKYGTGSFQFDGASMPTSFDLRVPASSDLLVTGDFTFEFWMNSASSANGQTANMVMFVSAAGAAGANGSTEPTNCIAVFAQPSHQTLPNKITVKFTTNGTAYGGTTNVNDGTWRHIAIVRSGTATNNVKVYQNGTQEVQFTYTGAVDFGVNYGLKIGQWVGQQTNCFYKGYLDEIRLTLAARYTSNFTPPAAAFSYP